MKKNEQEEKDVDIIDVDLYEEIEDEELLEILEEERQKALEREKQREEDSEPKRPFPRWIFWLIAIVMFLNVIALLPQTFSIPAIDFIKTSASLSQDEDIQRYKEAVVVIETQDGRGTGFSISDEGTIITNHHVIEGEKYVTIAFPEHGLYQGEVVSEYPDIDLAVVETGGEDLPSLSLAETPTFSEGEEIRFIGNPLRFNGIANEGSVIGYTQLSSWEQPVVMIEAPVYRGNSGSPIINENGKVIGIIFATLNHDEHGRVGLYVPLDYYYDKRE